jgi:hypothetical protein
MFWQKDGLETKWENGFTDPECRTDVKQNPPFPPSFSLFVERKGEKNNEMKRRPLPVVDVGRKWSDCGKPRITSTDISGKDSNVVPRE